MARGRHPSRIHIDPPDEATAAKYLIQWSGGELRSSPEKFPGLTSPELFGNNNPIEIDFGCGTGILACSRAKSQPEINVIGIDQSQKPLFCAIESAKAEKLDNVKFIRGDFHIMLPLLREASVANVFYLFANPPRDYFKERANAKRRNFLTNLYMSLVIGGRIYFTTDAPAFYDCMYNIAKNGLTLPIIETAPGEVDFMTKYRLLWEVRGKSFNSFVVEKGGL